MMMSTGCVGASQRVPLGALDDNRQNGEAAARAAAKAEAKADKRAAAAAAKRFRGQVTAATGQLLEREEKRAKHARAIPTADPTPAPAAGNTRVVSPWGGGATGGGTTGGACSEDESDAVSDSCPSDSGVPETVLSESLSSEVLSGGGGDDGADGPGKSTTFIAEAEKLARRSTDFADPLTGLCREVPGTAPGTKITNVTFTGAPGKRLADLKSNIQPLLGKGFGTTLSNTKTFARVGDVKGKNRYVGTPGCSKFGRGGPMFAYIQTFLEETFCPALREAFPDAIRRADVSGMHVFLNRDARFHIHVDEMGSHPEQAMLLIHVGHPGVWVQNTGVSGGHQSRVERSHGCVVSMTKDARVLRHGFSDPKDLGATLLFTADLKDGADNETIEKIRRHLAVAVNAILLIFDAETVDPDPSELAADGGPLVMAWDEFEKHSLSQINSRRGKAGGKKMAAMCAAVDQVEELERKKLEPGPELALAAAKALDSVQRIRAGNTKGGKAGGKKMAAMCAAVDQVEELERKKLEPGPELALAAAKALDSVQRFRAGCTKGGKAGVGAAKVRRSGAGGGTRKIRVHKGSRPFVVMYRKVHENEQPRECFGAVRTNGEVFCRIDDKNYPVLFAILSEFGYEVDASGRLMLRLRFNEGPNANFVLKHPNRCPKRSAFFERCTIVSGRLLTTAELKTNEKEASEWQKAKRKERKKAKRKEL